MSDTLLFFKKFLKYGFAISSAVPSSSYLSNTTISGIDWNRARIILEVGAGTGPITLAIAQHARKDARIISIERDPDFVKILHRRFENDPRIEVIEADINDLETVLGERGITEVDYVVSGLPTTSFPREMQDRFFTTIGHFLAPGGSYHQITEIPLLFWAVYRRYFEKVDFLLELRNFPPGGAYIGYGVKSAKRQLPATGTQIVAK